MTAIEKGWKKNQGGHNVGCKHRQNAASMLEYDNYHIFFYVFVLMF